MYLVVFRLPNSKIAKKKHMFESYVILELLDLQRILELLDLQKDGCLFQP